MNRSRIGFRLGRQAKRPISTCVVKLVA
uniref:Uncharacterized protein n=1 Tax=Vitis vinifera TaxID=29760 RepID=F6HEQ0_VITVI